MGTISSVIIVAGMLLLVGPKRMQQFVVGALLIVCFPKLASIAICIAAAGYYYYSKR